MPTYIRGVPCLVKRVHQFQESRCCCSFVVVLLLRSEAPLSYLEQAQVSTPLITYPKGWFALWPSFKWHAPLASLSSS